MVYSRDTFWNMFLSLSPKPEGGWAAGTHFDFGTPSRPMWPMRRVNEVPELSPLTGSPTAGRQAVCTSEVNILIQLLE